MSSSFSPETIQQLHPALWRADSLARVSGACLDSGFTDLNQQLPGQGWPLGQLLELFLAQPGSAELSLLAPALRQLSEGALLLLNPPFLPCALAYAGWQIPWQRCVWVRRQNQATVLWACEQALKQGACAAVICWAEGLKHTALRRLQLAAQSSQSLFCLVRPTREASQASPANLRIQVQTQAQGLRLRILKRRGMPHLAALDLTLPLHPYYLPMAPAAKSAHPEAATRLDRQNVDRSVFA